MTEEASKTWNEQLADWCKNSGKNISELAREAGINPDTFKEYVSGRRVKNIGGINPEKRDALYKLTGLEFFKYQGARIEISSPKPYQEVNKQEEASLGSVISELARKGKESIDKIVEQTSSELRGNQKLEQGLLKAQQQKPTAEKRTEAIIELLDVLAEEVDYFRTAPAYEKKLLTERLQKEPESFGYITQMLNIIYNGKQIDSWMLMAQPPSKIKRLREQR